MPAEKAPLIDESLTSAKLSRLQQYVRYLEELRRLDFKELISDFKAAGAVERYLQLSIECMIDIGNEIISSLQLQRPEKYRDIPYILANSGIIPREFADIMASMIGLRNLLVHDYASINHRLVYEFLQTRLGDFNKFSKYIAEWLKKRM